MLKDDPISGHVFIFQGRSGSQIKLLWSTGNGLCLLTKRLERERFAWPSARDGKVFLTQAQLDKLRQSFRKSLLLYRTNGNRSMDTGGGLPPNESENRYWKNSNSVASFC